MVTSTFSFAAHSLTSVSEALLAPGTQWSQKPIESLPAACAVRTNGAAIIVADAAADVATKRRRVILAFFMGLSPVVVCCLLSIRAPRARKPRREDLRDRFRD